MFETLLGLVVDNAEATAEIAAIQGKIKSNGEQDSATITSLKSQFEAAKSEKDNYKAGNALVKKALGLDRITEDTVADRLKELGSNKAAQELVQELAAKDELITAMKLDSEKALEGVKIVFEAEKALNDVSEILTDDPILRGLFKQELQKSVGISEGQVLPMQQIGDQKVPIVKDGKPQTLVDYAKNMLDADYKSFKKPVVKQGAGPTGGSNGTSGVADFIPV